MYLAPLTQTTPHRLLKCVLYGCEVPIYCIVYSSKIVIAIVYNCYTISSIAPDRGKQIKILHSSRANCRCYISMKALKFTPYGQPGRVSRR